MRWRIPRTGSEVCVETGPDTYVTATCVGYDGEGTVEVRYEDGTVGSADLPCIVGARTDWTDESWTDTPKLRKALARKLENPETPLTKEEFVEALRWQLDVFAGTPDEGKQPFEEWFEGFEEDVYAPVGP